MSVLRVQADFNGLVTGARNPRRSGGVLDTLGALRDLCNEGVQLTEGAPLVGFDYSDEDEDLEGHGTAHFVAALDAWIVEFDEQGVRYVPASDRAPVTRWDCARCRTDLVSQIDRVGLNVGEVCHACGAPVHAPLQPPTEDRSVVAGEPALLLPLRPELRTQEYFQLAAVQQNSATFNRSKPSTHQVRHLCRQPLLNVATVASPWTPA
jgi:hypothetical protein